MTRRNESRRTRRPESECGDSDNVLDKLSSPSELSDDLLVGESGELRMRPGAEDDGKRRKREFESQRALFDSVLKLVQAPGRYGNG